MPVNSTTGNIANLPLLSRDNRLRVPPAPVQEQALRDTPLAERNADPAVLVARESTPRESLVRSLDSTTLDLRSAPDLEALPTAQRNAILSYLQSASLGTQNTAEGAELIVGVDTFV